MKKKQDIPPPVFLVKKIREDRYIIECENTDYMFAGEYYTTYDEAFDRAIDLNLGVRR